MKQFNYFTGIRNPFASHKASFNYEVVKDFGVVNIEYEDTDGSLRTYPEKRILIKSLNGDSSLIKEELLVTVSLNDALKEYRAGDLITIDLKFHVSEDYDGELHQHVTGDNVFTLHDYQQICKAELAKKHE